MLVRVTHDVVIPRGALGENRGNSGNSADCAGLNPPERVLSSKTVFSF